MKVTAEQFKREYPFRSNHLDLQGFKYHYVDEGSGENVLMVHGTPAWSFFYRRAITGLRSRFRCVAPDHMGCGFSDKPQKYAYRLQTHIDNLESLVNLLGLGDINLVVHDWGAPIGIGMALRQPERVKRMIVLNSAAFLSRRVPFVFRLLRLPLLGAVAIRGFNTIATSATTLAVAKHERMTPVVETGYLAPYNSWANRIAHLRFLQDVPLSPRHPSYATLRAIDEGLPQLADRPVLICWGERDFVFTSHFLSEWRRRFPRAQVHTFADAGHYVLEDAHEKIIPLMRSFLED